MSKILVEVLTKDDSGECWVIPDDSCIFFSNSGHLALFDAVPYKDALNPDPPRVSTTYASGFWTLVERCPYGKEPT